MSTIFDKKINSLTHLFHVGKIFRTAGVYPPLKYIGEFS